MDQLITYLRNGLPQMPSAAPPGYRILRINAVRPMLVDLSEVRYLQLPEQEVEDYFLEDGDILFTRYNGSLELLGVAGMVRGCVVPTLHPDKLIRVKTVLGGLLASYVELASNIGVSRAHIESRSRTTAGQKGIAGTDIKQMPVPLPPLAEQRQIIAEVEQRFSIINQLEAAVEASLKRTERFRQSILKRAFAGQLVLQDPNDEPASVLLERIREERKRREREEQKLRKETRMTKAQNPKSVRAKKTGKQRTPLVQVLVEAKKPLPPDDLFRLAGLQQDVIEDVEVFFEETREAEGRQIKVTRPDTTQVFLEAVSE